MTNAVLPFSEGDIFRGFTEEDIPNIKALVIKNTTPMPGVYTDSVGVRVSPDYCPWICDKLGIVDTNLPVPNAYNGDGVEYAALALALNWASGREVFTVGELGAGWGPYTSAAAVLALRRGFPRVRCVAAEADPQRFEVLRRHLALNDLVPAGSETEGSADRVEWRLLRAAVNVNDGVLYWPKSDDILDAGMAAVSDPNSSTDTRGQAREFDEVRAVSLETAFANIDRVDFLHVDIQGAEGSLIPGSLDFLTERVSALFVGTHSRKIEGDIIDALHSRGWVLIREKPCQFYTSAPTATLEAKTWCDGGQFWRNSAFV